MVLFGFRRQPSPLAEENEPSHLQECVALVSFPVRCRSLQRKRGQVRYRSLATGKWILQSIRFHNGAENAHSLLIAAFSLSLHSRDAARPQGGRSQAQSVGFREEHPQTNLRKLHFIPEMRSDPRVEGVISLSSWIGQGEVKFGSTGIQSSQFPRQFLNLAKDVEGRNKIRLLNIFP